MSELPRMYHNKIDKDLNNNERVFSTLDSNGYLVVIGVLRTLTLNQKKVLLRGNMKVSAFIIGGSIKCEAFLTPLLK